VTWPSYLAAKAAKAKPKPKPVFPPGLKPDRAKPSARTLQQQLKRAGYMPKSVREADNYGPATQKAVARFHNANPKYRAKGKSYDPKIGAKGWAKLWTLG
jgi:peptidoglycan hydrolase-like protein with peptidoglycan-binding domain